MIAKRFNFIVKNQELVNTPMSIQAHANWLVDVLRRLSVK